VWKLDRKGTCFIDEPHAMHDRRDRIHVGRGSHPVSRGPVARGLLASRGRLRCRGGRITGAGNPGPLETLPHRIFRLVRGAALPGA